MHRRSSLFPLTLCVLAACSGGGGGSSAVPAPPGQPPGALATAAAAPAAPLLTPTPSTAPTSAPTALTTPQPVVTLSPAAASPRPSSAPAAPAVAPTIAPTPVPPPTPVPTPVSDAHSTTATIAAYLLPPGDASFNRLTGSFGSVDWYWNPSAQIRSNGVPNFCTWLQSWTVTQRMQTTPSWFFEIDVTPSVDCQTGPLSSGIVMEAALPENCTFVGTTITTCRWGSPTEHARVPEPNAITLVTPAASSRRTFPSDNRCGPSAYCNTPDGQILWSAGTTYAFRAGG